MLPNRSLTNHDITKVIEDLRIPHFRGVFMRDNLPKSKVWDNECMVVNQDSIKNAGTKGKTTLFIEFHWFSLVSLTFIEYH